MNHLFYDGAPDFLARGPECQGARTAREGTAIVGELAATLVPIS